MQSPPKNHLPIKKIMKEIVYFVLFTLSSYETVPCPTEYVIDPLTKQKVESPIVHSVLCHEEKQDTIQFTASAEEYEKWSRIADVSFRKPMVVHLFEISDGKTDTIIYNRMRYKE